MKRLLQLSFLLFSIFYFSQTFFNGEIVNTDPQNRKFRKSRQFFYGQLTNQEYLDKKSLIEKELETIIPQGKSIFITYEQAAKNCSLISYGSLKNYHNLHVKIAKHISSQNNAEPFFIFKDDSFPNVKKFTEINVNFKLDSGFFSENIFTLQENCEAFFILKPNGNYLICYGTDSFSYASDFLKRKKVKKK